MSLEWLAVLAVATAVCAALVFTAATARIDNTFYDLLLRHTHRHADPDIIIVAIDDQSLQDVGAWPWPRGVHARLLDRLTAAGARAVAYDVLFVEPATDPAQDQALAAAAARAGNLCLPVDIQVPGANGAGFDILAPVSPLAAVVGLGHVDMPYDADGVARRAILSEGDGRHALPHLMACAQRATPGARHAMPVLPSGANGQDLVRGRPTLIPFTQPGSYPTVPASSVLKGEVPPAFLRGKYVLVGATAAGLHDRHATPVTRRGGAMPGIEVEANLLDGLLTGGVARPAGLTVTLAVSEAGIVLLMLALAVLSPRRAWPFGFALLLAALGVSAASLGLAHLWLPPFAFILTALLVFPLWGWRRLETVSRYMLEELRRFAAEPEVLPLRALRDASGDTVAQQIQLMNQTVQRVRDLRQFATDTLRSLPDPTLVVSLQGAILFANPAARALAQGVNFSAAPRLRQFAQGWTDLSGEALQFPAAQQIGEGWTGELRAPTGLPYLAAIAPYRDTRGVLAAWIVRLTDISELKAAEAQREQIVQLLTHDMRSPQSSILALLDTAPAGAISDDLSRKVEAYARRTLALAGNFVQLARAGAAVLPFELLDLADVVTEAADELWPQAKRAGVSLTAAGTDAEQLVSGERALLTRAVINLLDNAIKYSRAGSAITAALSRDGDHAVLSIADQGIGMTAEQRGALFTPFQRFTAPDKRFSDGAGLGLTLVWEVIRRHGGTITVAETPGGGTTFAIRLPLVVEA